MLLIVVQLPAGDSKAALAQAAALCGLTAADVNARIGGLLPRSLLSDADPGRIAELRGRLKGLGFHTAACDPASVRTDGDRLIARRLEEHPEGLVVIDRAEGRHVVPRGALRLLQRGVRVSVTSSTQQVTEKKFSVGLAAMTGGLMTRKSVSHTVNQQSESREAFVLLQRGDGGPDVMLYERRLDYRFLGAKMGPASMGNLLASIEWLRGRAPALPMDDRVLRPGFVKGLPLTAADPVDLALEVVLLAHGVLLSAHAPGAAG